MFYAKTNIPKLRLENAELGLIDASRQAGADWRSMTDKQKKPYQDLAD